MFLKAVFNDVQFVLILCVAFKFVWLLIKTITLHHFIYIMLIAVIYTATYQGTAGTLRTQRQFLLLILYV